MEFEEFRRATARYRAYSGWISVADAKLMGMIPKEYNDLFKDYCICGSENIIASNLRREMCCDPRCEIKVSYALAEMFSRYGVQDLGPARCKTVYTALKAYDKFQKEHGKPGLFRFNSYTEVLLIPWSEYPMNASDNTARIFAGACAMIRSTKVTFPKLIGNLGIPSLHGNAEKIFDGINSVNELTEKIKSDGGIIQFMVRRGVHSPEIIYNVASNLDTIAIAEYACRQSLKQSGYIHMSVCITGRVVCDGVSMTKSAFIDKCNELCIDKDGHQMFEIKNTSGVSSVPFILYSAGSSSEKFRAGLARGTVIDELGTHKVLITVTQFYKLLEGAMMEWNKQKNTQGADMMEVMREQVSKMTLQTAQAF